MLCVPAAASPPRPCGVAYTPRGPHGHRLSMPGPSVSPPPPSVRHVRYRSDLPWAGGVRHVPLVHRPPDPPQARRQSYGPAPLLRIPSSRCAIIPVVRVACTIKPPAPPPTRTPVLVPLVRAPLTAAPSPPRPAPSATPPRALATLATPTAPTPPPTAPSPGPPPRAPSPVSPLFIQSRIRLSPVAHAGRDSRAGTPTPHLSPLAASNLSPPLNEIHTSPATAPPTLRGPTRPWCNGTGPGASCLGAAIVEVSTSSPVGGCLGTAHASPPWMPSPLTPVLPSEADLSSSQPSPHHRRSPSAHAPRDPRGSCSPSSQNRVVHFIHAEDTGAGTPGSRESPVYFFRPASFINSLNPLVGQRSFTDVLRSYGDLKLHSWTCPACNAENLAAHLECSECHTIRPDNAPTQLELWRCPKCETVNHVSMLGCQSCSLALRPFNSPVLSEELMMGNVEMSTVISECGSLHSSVASPVASPKMVRRARQWTCFECASVNVKVRCERCGADRREEDRWIQCPCGVAHPVSSKRTHCVACGIQLMKHASPRT